MANENERPDIDTFMRDPRFQKDREFLGQFMEKELERRAAEAKTKPKAENIFDALFGVKSSEEKPSIFDLPFLPKK
jgi:hypothetical protein